MNVSDSGVECTIHGLQGPAYVCRHLGLDHPVGFIEAYDPDEPDAELFQAWCDECDRVLLEQGEWNDVSEAFASPRMVCRTCYAQMKALNQSARGNPAS